MMKTLLSMNLQYTYWMSDSLLTLSSDSSCCGEIANAQHARGVSSPHRLPPLHSARTRPGPARPAHLLG